MNGRFPISDELCNAKADFLCNRYFKRKHIVKFVPQSKFVLSGQALRYIFIPHT